MMAEIYLLVFKQGQSSCFDRRDTDRKTSTMENIQALSGEGGGG